MFTGIRRFIEVVGAISQRCNVPVTLLKYLKGIITLAPSLVNVACITDLDGGVMLLGAVIVIRLNGS